MPWEINEDEDEIPCVADPCWIADSAPVLAFLQTSAAKGWPEIMAWATENKLNTTILRHCVAWLEEKGLARSFLKDGKTMWTAMRH